MRLQTAANRHVESKQVRALPSCVQTGDLKHHHSISQNLKEQPLPGIPSTMEHHGRDVTITHGS